MDGGEPLEPLREVDLVVGGIVGESIVPQRLLGDRDTVGFGERRPLVDRAELHVVAGLVEHLGHRRLLERAGVREAGPAVGDDPDAEPITSDLGSIPTGFTPIALVTSIDGLAGSVAVMVGVVANKFKTSSLDKKTKAPAKKAEAES